jgi:hypothetical protein
MVNLRERVIELSGRISTLRSEIAALESKKVELARAEHELDSCIAPPPSTSINGQVSIAETMVAPIINPNLHTNGDSSLTERVLSILLNAPPGGLTAEQIQVRMPTDTNMDSLRSALARLATEHRIDRVSRGSYKGRELQAL